jgi:hypothetical protein
MIRSILAVATLLLFSCTSRTSNQESKNTDSSSVKKENVIKEHEEKDNEEEKKLTLNQGKKWKLDDVSRINVAAIKKTVDAGNTNDPKALAVSIRQGTDKLVKECRMQGADHEALHLWLEGFLKDLKELESGNQSEAQEKVKELKEDLDKFYQYFE